MKKDEKYSDDEKVLILSALLHDIGKLIQRANTEESNKLNKLYGEYNYSYNAGFHGGAHARSSAAFIKENLKNIFEKSEIEHRTKVIDIILNHHDNSIGLQDKTLENALKIIKKADGLSSYEREKLPKEEKGKEKVNKNPMISPFSNICNYNKNYYYELKAINASEKMYPLGTKEEVFGSGYSDLTQQYNYLFETFDREFKKLVSLEHMDLEKLNYLLKKYLQYVPSAAYYHEADVSLYDHLKTTTAIALCLKRGSTGKPFLLVEGDISGIQNFIFSSFRSMEADKGSAKRLRGRSLYIYLLTDAVVRHILTSLKLPVFNVLLKSGGHFQILAPNTEENTKLLKDIKSQVNAYLYNSYGCILYMVIGYKSGDKNDIKNYSAFKEKVTQKTDADKRKKFEFLFDKKQSKRPILKEGEICKICGIDKIADKEKKSCKTCSKIVELGSKFLNDGESYYVCDSPEKSDIQFVFGKNVIAYKFGEHNDASCIEKVIVNSMDIIDNNADSFSLLGRYAPLTEDRKHPLSFEDIVGKTAGREDHPKLAVLKADVDNLGYIFAFGLQSETEDQKELKTISRVTTLSFMFDLFFSKCINNIAKNHNCYIVFSGGDDLIVVGKYNNITEFAKDIHDEFSKWCADNKSITLSVGVAMADCKFPIKRLIKYADDALYESKEAKKDKITIFGHTLKWDEYKKALELVGEFSEKEKAGVLATSSIYPLINLHKKTQDKDEVNKKRDIVISPDPYIKYIITRNWNKKNDYENRNAFIRKILDNFNHIDVIVSLFSLNHRYRKK